MPEIELSDSTLHYEEAGEGPPLLLLHGGLGTALLHYRREIPVFAKRYRVIAPDMRGYGRSSPPREYPPGFYHRDAADMAALLERLGAHPAHVLGWSDGAVVALTLTVTRPDLVRSLVTWGGEARLLEQERAAWPALADTSTWSERAVERFKEAQGPLNWPGIFQKMLDGYNAVLDAGGEIVSRRVGEIRCPVLLLHGELDDVVPVAHARELHAAIPHSELHIWPDAGHALHREKEAELRRLVMDFLNRHEQADRGSVGAGPAA
jgi:valacyclovir hydrolase